MSTGITDALVYLNEAVYALDDAITNLDNDDKVFLEQRMRRIAGQIIRIQARYGIQTGESISELT